MDMRLWRVHSGDGRWIGTVDELLVDAVAGEVRHLDVEVENVLVTGRERHVLIPVAHARPDVERSGTLVVDTLTARAVRGLLTDHRDTVVQCGDARYARPFAAAERPGPCGLDFAIRVAQADPPAERGGRE
ncbi:MAG TPA: PRC-barrel domain-containing protein, partial [Longimicrobium sp.]